MSNIEPAPAPATEPVPTYDSITQIAPKIERGELSPVELVEASLSRISEHDSGPHGLNAFLGVWSDQAIADARAAEKAISSGGYLGPLHGIPVGLKDLIDVAGRETTGGSKVLAGNIAKSDSRVAKKLRAAGAILIGKLNLVEFAIGTTGLNPTTGDVKNPWDRTHITAGSSSGSAAAVASGMIPAALGTDTGGSVRMPASLCGISGLKPTYGRVSRSGVLDLSWSMDHIGPMTRSVSDSALVLQALAGYDPLDPSTVPVPVPDYSAALAGNLQGMKMGIPSNYFFDLVDSEVEAAVRLAIEALQELGVEIKEVSLPNMEYSGALRFSGMADSVVTHEPYIQAKREDYGPDTLYRTLAGQFVLGRDYSKALKVQRIIQEEHARVLQEVDFLVTPTAPVAAPRIDAKYITLGGEEHRVRGPGSGVISRNTSPENATGLPAITVPCGFNQAGLPIGIQFIGRAFDESTLFRVAQGYESVSPSRGHWPAVAA